MLQNIMCTNSLCQSQGCEFTAFTDDVTEVTTLILQNNLKHQVCSIGTSNILLHVLLYTRNSTVEVWYFWLGVRWESNEGNKLSCIRLLMNKRCIFHKHQDWLTEQCRLQFLRKNCWSVVILICTAKSPNDPTELKWNDEAQLEKILHSYLFTCYLFRSSKSS